MTDCARADTRNRSLRDGVVPANVGRLAKMDSRVRALGRQLTYF
jgi:hypothetical protein